MYRCLHMYINCSSMIQLLAVPASVDHTETRRQFFAEFKSRDGFSPPQD